jgi:hypothetical protein
VKLKGCVALSGALEGSLSLLPPKDEGLYGDSRLLRGGELRLLFRGAKAKGGKRADSGDSVLPPSSKTCSSLSSIVLSLVGGVESVAPSSNAKEGRLEAIAGTGIARVVEDIVLSRLHHA